jgi:argininosuccinate lyase
MWMPRLEHPQPIQRKDLVERGVPSRLAHEAVGKAVQMAAERGCELQKLPLADLQAIYASSDAAFHSASSSAPPRCAPRNRSPPASPE